jgi:tetratricopeptide (TPR) repeat protein
VKTAIAAALFAASFASLAPGQPAEPETPPAPAARPAASPGPPLNTPGRAVWASDFDDATRRAKEQGKVVFVEFTKKKCGNCFRMDGLLYPSANFEMALLRMVPVKLDLDQADVAKLANRYQVASTPAILVVSPGGAIIFRMVGFKDDRSFYVHLHNSMKDWDAVNLRIVHEPETIANAKAELELGKELFRRVDSAEALPRFERAAAAPGAAPAVREEALAYLASSQMELEKFDDARATTEKLLKTAKDPDRREKAELFRAQIMLAEGRREDARRDFQSFLTRHPESKHKDEAKSYLDQMKALDGAKPE